MSVPATALDTAALSAGTRAPASVVRSAAAAIDQLPAARRRTNTPARLPPSDVVVRTSPVDDVAVTVAPAIAREPEVTVPSTLTAAFSNANLRPVVAPPEAITSGFGSMTYAASSAAASPAATP